jgi:twitching motility protein PilT
MPVKIDDLLKIAIGFGASDLHVKAGSFPFIRVGGELRPAANPGRYSGHGILHDDEPAEAKV